MTVLPEPRQNSVAPPVIGTSGRPGRVAAPLVAAAYHSANAFTYAPPSTKLKINLATISAAPLGLSGPNGPPAAPPVVVEVTREFEKMCVRA